MPIMKNHPRVEKPYPPFSLPYDLLTYVFTEQYHHQLLSTFPPGSSIDLETISIEHRKLLFPYINARCYDHLDWEDTITLNQAMDRFYEEHSYPGRDFGDIYKAGAFIHIYILGLRKNMKRRAIFEFFTNNR